MTESENILNKELGTDWMILIQEQPYYKHVLQAIHKARTQGQTLPIDSVSGSLPFMCSECGTFYACETCGCTKCNDR